jgi:hypothetical protein
MSSLAIKQIKLRPFHITCSAHRKPTKFLYFVKINSLLTVLLKFSHITKNLVNLHISQKKLFDKVQPMEKLCETTHMQKRLGDSYILMPLSRIC